MKTNPESLLSLMRKKELEALMTDSLWRRIVQQEHCKKCYDKEAKDKG